MAILSAEEGAKRLTGWHGFTARVWEKKASEVRIYLSHKGQDAGYAVLRDGEDKWSVGAVKKNAGGVYKILSGEECL